MSEMYEVYRNGVPTKRLFGSVRNAKLWISTHCHDDAEYTIETYIP